MTERNDRELLELAAKAAGINTKECPVFEYGVDWGGKAGIWNPLTDDGDALRLAVKLRISIDFHRQAVADGLACPKWYAVENQHPDWNAATRMAIVRAAAEIGRNMK